MNYSKVVHIKNIGNELFCLIEAINRTESSTESRLKNITSKLARLRVTRRLFISREAQFGSDEFRDRLEQIQKKTRLCRWLLLRFKRFDCVYSLFTNNTFHNCLHFSLHRPYTSPIPSRKTDGVTNYGVLLFPSIPSYFLPPVEEVRPQHSIAHGKLGT